MHKRLGIWLAAAVAGPLLVACQSDGAGGSTGTAGTSGTASTGTATPSSPAPTSGSGGGSSIPSLVNVNLNNVLNDLAIKLNIDRANVPVTIQLPIQLAANVCGVSVNVLSVSTGGQANCTASSAPQELAQVVQQQMAAGGSVGGGAQGGSTAAVGGSSPTSGSSSGGSTGTQGTSSGATQ
jgi:hypothetical protein